MFNQTAHSSQPDYIELLDFIVLLDIRITYIELLFFYWIICIFKSDDIFTLKMFDQTASHLSSQQDYIELSDFIVLLDNPIKLDFRFFLLNYPYFEKWWHFHCQDVWPDPVPSFISASSPQKVTRHLKICLWSASWNIFPIFGNVFLSLGKIQHSKVLQLQKLGIFSLTLRI